jgi:hypothetical protein
VALLALAGSAAGQATLNVDALGAPGAYTTIQSALDASASGDTILVAPGLYLETIDFLGKDVAVIADGAGGPAAHVIDAQGDPSLPAGPAGEQYGGGPVVTFANGEGPGALLDGFTVTGGVGWTPGTSGLDTGGIRIWNASPTIRSCHVVGNLGGAGNYPNQLGTGGDGGTGGLSADGGSPTIEACEFRDNIGGPAKEDNGPCPGSYYGGAGAVRVSSGDTQIRDCLFQDNVGAPGAAGWTCHGHGGNVLPAHGPGALWVRGIADISGCVLSGNVGGADPSYTFGDPIAPGGVLVGEMIPVGGHVFHTFEARITDTQFLGNSGGALVAGYTCHQGGCLLSATLEDCVLAGNTGRTVHVLDENWAMLQLQNCVLIGNSGGEAIAGNWSTQVFGCVITEHDAAGQSLICMPDGFDEGCYGEGAVVTNSILWNNVPAYQEAWISASCVEGGYPGSGNIAADPLFVRAPSPGPDGIWGTADDDLGDLRLAPGSPCIDAGDNDLVPFGIHSDLDGNVRFFDDLATADTGVAGALGGPAITDMGAFERGAPPSGEWTGLGHALGESPYWWNWPKLGGSGALIGGTPTTLLLVDAAPGGQAFLVLGLAQVDAPFKQGVLVPSPDMILPLMVDATGSIAFTVPWPDGLPSGLEVVSQYWIQDATGPAGFSASNALRSTTP